MKPAKCRPGLRVKLRKDHYSSLKEKTPLEKAQHNKNMGSALSCCGSEKVEEGYVKMENY